MCLIAFSWQPDAPTPLVLAANRDEFFERPTEPMHWWAGEPLLAGRDLRDGGTWLGLTRDGRFAALTNYRDPAHQRPQAPSRGTLPLKFLRGQARPRDFVDALQADAEQYNGFNLLVGDVARRELWWLSNRARAAVAVTPGVHGLSNALLDTPWPKVAHSMQRLGALLHSNAAPDHAQLLDAMLDTRVADDAALPSTGVGIDTERMLSPAFIRGPRYGTRSTTLVTASDAGAQVTEQSHAHPGQAAQQRQFEWAWQRER